MAAGALQQYVKLVEFLGLALGPDYEIVLHDLTDKNNSLIAIANGHISGRKVGAPLTNVGLRVLMDRSYLTQDYRLHDEGRSSTGKALRSCTFFIKEQSRVLGMLCINFDDSRYEELSEAVLRLCHPDSFASLHLQPAAEPEQFPASAADAAGDAVRAELVRLGLDGSRLTPDERLRIISALDAAGVFLLKGAVGHVANELHCSAPSVYRYLAKLRSPESASLQRRRDAGE